MGREPRLEAWGAKLAAWLHDPAEKALILLRADHERDSSIARLRELLFGGEEAERPPEDLERTVRLADHWASAADRPTMPRQGAMPGNAGGDGKVLFWGREGAVLIHPLDGTQYRLPDVYVDTASTIEKASFAGLLGVLDKVDDPRTAFLRFWRLGPEARPPTLELGHLWQLLPADTRIPDHSIWEHLSLASAFAGAMAADPEGNPALLAVSIGPVQGFIAQARSTSDLWAGSHLLAWLSWTAMRVVCETCGPDAVLFPNLWGVPLVDAWLEERGVAFPEGKKAPAWKRSASDANPLFTAALPNRFVALVPAAAAKELAATLTHEVREEAMRLGEHALRELLEAAGYGEDAACDAREQLRRQLAEFPEVQWAVVPFAPLVTWREAQGGERPRTTVASTEGLRDALAAFHPDPERPGFLGSEQWKLLEKSIEGGGIVYVPNPGVLYPALYDLLDRVHAAAKAVRPFVQVWEEGYRCTLCGEREWLRGPGDGGKERRPRGGRGETLWARVGERRRSWARKGEHLCAWCALKRLWPTEFAQWAADRVESIEREKLDRFVVSTHTMAVARDLLDLADRGGGDGSGISELRELVEPHAGSGPAPLPRKVYRAVRGVPDLWPLAGQIPAALDAVSESEDLKARARLEAAVKQVLGHAPEAYYAMILFDGDRMGAWISGTDPELCIAFREAFHPKTADAIREAAQGHGSLGEYLAAKRPPSPGRHQAISAALNGFALHVVPWVVEELFAGKVIYAGGDDVLAMLPVDDVLPALLVLRAVYSGYVPGGKDAVWELLGKLREELEWIDRGHVLVGGKGGRLVRVMGRLATASAGVVIAHHTAPLQAVLRELRAAERRAKDEGGRNAFSVTLLKRAGGTTRFTAGFGFGGPGWEPAAGGPTALGALFALRDTLATEGVSRRAAYNVLAWLPSLPPRPDAEGAAVEPEAYREMLSRALAWQLRRQGVDWPIGGDAWSRTLAERLVAAAEADAGRRRSGEPFSYTGFLEDLFTVAEFVAREGRATPRDKTGEDGGSGRPAAGTEGGAA